MKKIMACVDLNDHSLSLYKDKLKDRDWSDIEEFHLVHGFRTEVYTDTFYFTSYPSEDQYEDVEKSVDEVLARLEKDLFTSGKAPKVIRKCFISASPKDSIVDYAKETNIDEMIVGTRGKHGLEGLFSSSFAEHMVRYAPCELRILRA